MILKINLTAIINNITAKIFFTAFEFNFFCIKIVPKVAPAIPAIDAIMSICQLIFPIAQYVRNPEKEEKGTTKAVIAVIFLGLNPNINIKGEIIPPPPIPSIPESKPAIVPINVTYIDRFV